MCDPAPPPDPQAAASGRPDPAAAIDWLIASPDARPAGPIGQVRARPLAAAFAVAALVAVLLCAGLAWRKWGGADDGGAGRHAPVPRIAAPFAPGKLRALSPDQAAQWNAAVPVSDEPNPAAAEFAMAAAGATDFQRALQCLTMAVYYEAGFEGADGERAVAQVVLNRVRHPAYPASVCGVVFEGSQRRTGCQFTFTCDGALARLPDPDAWRRAGEIAASALSGLVYAPVGLATHYHAAYVVPYWAARLDKVTTIGAHVFYRWRGGWGKQGAFTDRYVGAEPALSYLVAPTPGATGIEPVPAAPAETPALAPTARPVLLGGGSGTGAGATGVGLVTPGPGAAGPAEVVGIGERRIILRRGPDMAERNADTVPVQPRPSAAAPATD